MGRSLYTLLMTALLSGCVSSPTAAPHADPLTVAERLARHEGQTSGLYESVTLGDERLAGVLAYYALEDACWQPEQIAQRTAPVVVAEAFSARPLAPEQASLDLEERYRFGLYLAALSHSRAYASGRIVHQHKTRYVFHPSEEGGSLLRGLWAAISAPPPPPIKVRNRRVRERDPMADCQSQADGVDYLGRGLSWLAKAAEEGHGEAAATLSALYAGQAPFAEPRPGVYASRGQAWFWRRLTAHDPHDYRALRMVEGDPLWPQVRPYVTGAEFKAEDLTPAHFLQRAAYWAKRAENAGAVPPAEFSGLGHLTLEQLSELVEVSLRFHQRLAWRSGFRLPQEGSGDYQRVRSLGYRLEAEASEAHALYQRLGQEHGVVACDPAQTTLCFVACDRAPYCVR